MNKKLILGIAHQPNNLGGETICAITQPKESASIEKEIHNGDFGAMSGKIDAL